MVKIMNKELVEMQILLRKYKVPQRSIDKIMNREKELQQRIDKAIEYNQKIYDTSTENERLMAKINLDILRGENNVKDKR